jgi:hypothetical protein
VFLSAEVKETLRRFNEIPFIEFPCLSAIFPRVRASEGFMTPIGNLRRDFAHGLYRFGLLHICLKGMKKKAARPGKVAHY